MAVRVPLIWDSGLRQANTIEIGQIKTEMIRQYGLNPAVSLDVVASGGDLGAISDTRMTAGAYSTSTTAYPSELVTAEPGSNTINYDRITLSNTAVSAPADANNRYFFTFLDGSNHVCAFTLQDMIDTFALDVIDTLTEANNTSDQAGTFHVSTELSVAGSSLVNTTPIFSDTRANTSLYAAASIPEALDQPFTVDNYYLHQIDPAAEGTYPLCFRINDDDDLVQANTVEMGLILANVVQYVATSYANSKIDYSIANGNIKGTGMSDTKLNGSGDYQIRFVNADDYRAQEFPDGTPSTITTTYLRIRQV